MFKELSKPWFTHNILGYVQGDGLVADTYYQPGVPDAAGGAKGRHIGQAAWQWYQPHSLPSHVAALYNLIRQPQVELR